MKFGSVESEHPRLTNGEIISDVFQPTRSQSSSATDRQTDTDDMRSQQYYRSNKSTHCWPKENLCRELRQDKDHE